MFLQIFHFIPAHFHSNVQRGSLLLLRLVILCGIGAASNRQHVRSSPDVVKTGDMSPAVLWSAALFRYIAADPLTYVECVV